jgi:hypothetical protein
MSNAKVTAVDLTVHTDVPHRGEECSVGFNWEGGSAGFSTNIARGTAIMQAVGYADGVEYDPQTNALHIVIKATP